MCSTSGSVGQMSGMEPACGSYQAWGPSSIAPSCSLCPRIGSWRPSVVPSCAPRIGPCGPGASPSHVRGLGAWGPALPPPALCALGLGPRTLVLLLPPPGPACWAWVPHPLSRVGTPSMGLEIGSRETVPLLPHCQISGPMESPVGQMTHYCGLGFSTHVVGGFAVGVNDCKTYQHSDAVTETSRACTGVISPVYNKTAHLY